MSSNPLNPFNTGAHLYLEICVRLDHFIDIRKSLWRALHVALPGLEAGTLIEASVEERVGVGIAYVEKGARRCHVTRNALSSRQTHLTCTLKG
ncbi:hypothetical protein E2C01_074112 [Portunus trituberculatus]|uniref:Uncharacterized protein n=1 Tax=Portunus trituberculatus TaxID=210409 RepID=A0A5B7IDG9_PORTR|nr:hypothetical protein [Portunus trituberculatus]